MGKEESDTWFIKLGNERPKERVCCVLGPGNEETDQIIIVYSSQESNQADITKIVEKKHLTQIYP